MSDEDVKRVVDAVQARFPVESWSFNPEIGDKIDFQFKQPPSQQDLQAAVEGAGVGVREVRAEQGLAAGTKSFAVITQGIREKIERDLTSRFAEAKPDVRRVEYVGPAVGASCATRASRRCCTRWRSSSCTSACGSTSGSARA